MATIGLSKPYFAIYSNTGTTVSYADGGLIGKAVELTMELEGAEENALYADNGIAESDNEFAGGTLTLMTDDLLPEPMLAILGIKSVPLTIDGLTTENATELVFDDTQTTPYVGFGAILKKKINNATKWQAIVYTKIKFQNNGVSAVTQGETIEWQTPELTALVLRDDSVNHVWNRISSPLDTEADAETYIKHVLNIQ